MNPPTLNEVCAPDPAESTPPAPKAALPRATPPATVLWLEVEVLFAEPRPTDAPELLVAPPEVPASAADHGPPATVAMPLELEPAPAELLVPPAMTPPAKADDAAILNARTDARRIFFIYYFPKKKLTG